MAKCSVSGCENEIDRKGLCTRHYMRERRNGDPTKGRRRPGETASFIRDTVLGFSGDDCLIWPFFTNKKQGYAQCKIDGKLRLVHRYVCETINGPPPTNGHQAAHHCGVRNCVNPRHISWKTPLENEADKKRHGTYLSGQKVHNATLTDDEAIAIKVLRGRIPNAVIAEIFGVSKGAVSSIQLGRSRTR